MTLESGKDYSFLLQAPGQLRALFEQCGVTLEHPAILLPPVAWVVATLALADGAPRLLATLEQREELIRLADRDPLHYGYEPGPPHCALQCWEDARRLLYSHDLTHITSRNRNTKTEFAGKEVVKLALTGDKIIWCLCETEQTSKRAGGQQEVVWKYFPPEWKALNSGKRSDRFKVSYSAGGRFTDNFVIVPTPLPGKPQAVTEIRFMYYAQGIQIIEGGAIDLFWADENCPVEWLKTFLYRLADRHGHGLLTYTPVNGWNDTYGEIYQGCEVVSQQAFPIHTEKKHWPGCDVGHIPYIVQPVNPRYAGIFFPPDANPYVPFRDVYSICAQEGYEQQMIRLAGIAQKKAGNPFPKFGRWHIIPAAQIPKQGTNYQLMDFQGRNWFMLWVRVVKVGGVEVHYVYREWPDKKTYGEWALPSGRPTGARGPAQETIQLGYVGYRELILSREGWTREELPYYVPRGVPPRAGIEMIADRLGDPRSGRAPVQTGEDGGTCNFDELTRLGIEVRAAKGLIIGEGLSRIRDLLNFNEEQFRADGNRFTPLNSPALFFSDECENTTDCVRIYTERCPEKDNAAKDPIDLLRYMATEDLQDEAGMVWECKGGGAY